MYFSQLGAGKSEPGGGQSISGEQVLSESGESVSVPGL